MAKRKATTAQARASARRPARRRTAKAAKNAATRTRATKKSAARSSRTRKATRRSPAQRSRPAARKKPARTAARAARPSAKRAPAMKKVARRTAPPAAPARKPIAPAKPAARRAAAAAPVRPASVLPRTEEPRSTPRARKVPALDRQRRTVTDDDLLPTPPSSLDLDRTASSARSGRREIDERRHELTQTGPTLTAGDVDADWESAYSVGDEAPGGDNPTPDQDIVDEIGEAVGMQYQDNEELKGEEKLTRRDRHRWELDPASSDDYDER